VRLSAVIEAAVRHQLVRDHELPAPAINTKFASIHTPFGLDGIFTFH
jgi:hypothetical protein